MIEDVQPDKRQVFTVDHAGLDRITMRSLGVFSNSLTGIGGARDPRSYTSIGQPTPLSDPQLGWLYEDELIAKAVNLIPLAAASRGLRYAFKKKQYGVDSESISQYLDSRCKKDLFDSYSELYPYSLIDLLCDASIDARVYGNGYIFLEVDDGNEPEEPININNISAIASISKIAPDLLTFRDGFYEFTYRTKPEQNVKISRRIHPSRVLKFVGKVKPETAKTYSVSSIENRDYSIIAGIYKAVMRFSQSLDSSDYLLQTASVFDYGIDGLSSVKNRQDEDLISRRMQSVMLALSSLKIFTRDSTKETVGTINRSLAGVSEILERLKDAIAFCSDTPVYKLFGDSNQRGLGAGAAGSTEERNWDEIITNWRSQHWKKEFYYIGRLALRSADGVSRGRDIPTMSVEIPPLQDQSEGDRLGNLDTFSVAAERLIRNKIVTNQEARNCFASGTPDYNLLLESKLYPEEEESEIAESVDPNETSEIARPKKSDRSRLPNSRQRRLGSNNPG